jgi:uncharacterized membrane protein YjjB (DUF3815 family)
MWQYYLLIILGGFLASSVGALLYQVPVRQALMCGVIGVLASVVKLTAGEASLNIVLSTFLASLLVAFLSHVAARLEKMPVTVFLIPCIFLFVPGAGMYQIVYSLIESRPADATMYFFETMEIAGAIALAIFAVDTIFKRRVNVHTKCTGNTRF